MNYEDTMRNEMIAETDTSENPEKEPYMGTHPNGMAVLGFK